MAADRGVAPLPAVRSGHALLVQALGDHPGADPCGVVPEDPANGRGLGLVDAPGPGLARNKIVAVADPAARPALPDPAFEPAMGLLGQVLEVEGVHRALETNMELADLALGHGHQPHAGEAELLEQGRRVLLVAREPAPPPSLIARPGVAQS